MAATRIHHFGVGSIAPDASTGVFFLAGLMLASPLWFLAFAVEAILLDAVAIGIVGIADACVTLGYWTLFAGYLALWFAGRLVRPVGQLGFFEICKMICVAAAGAIVFFVLSNLGHYFGGGYEESMGSTEYVARVSRYFPLYFFATLGYAAAGIAVFVVAARTAGGGRLAAR